MNQNPNNPYESTSYGSGSSGQSNPNYSQGQYEPTQQAGPGANYPPSQYPQPNSNPNPYPPNPYEQTPGAAPSPYPYPGGPPTPTPAPPPYNQAGYPNQPPAYDQYNQGGGMPPPSQQPRPSNGRRIGLIALVVVVLLAIIGTAIYIPVHNNQVANDNANSTATAVSIHNAAATAQANVTATAQTIATATAVASTYPFSATTTLNDPLTDNSKGMSWKTSGNCSFSGSAYHAINSTDNTYYTCPATKSDYTNFTYQATMQINKGSIAGITFRGDENAGKNYSFIFDKSGAYVFFLYTSSSSKPSQLQSGDASSAGFKAGLGQSNDIGVVARGSSIDLYVNKQKVASVTDSALSHGQIGFIVYDTGNDATDASFTNAEVWKLS
jgi:hypothetical protein